MTVYLPSCRSPNDSEKCSSSCFRDYCTDLKAQSDNNTQFLIDFNQYIDTKTPNNPLCEYLSGLNPELSCNRECGTTAWRPVHWGCSGVI